MNIAVFGSGTCHKNSNVYQDAFELGNNLAKNAYDIINGGYSGIMKATFEGAANYNNAKIAVTYNCSKKPNKFANHIIKTNSYLERLLKLIELADAYVVLNGKSGTLLELSCVLSLNERNVIKKPLIIFDEKWEKVLNAMDYDFSLNRGSVYFAKDIYDVIYYLNIFFEKNATDIK